jgi:hypothetical protein
MDKLTRKLLGCGITLALLLMPLGCQKVAVAPPKVAKQTASKPGGHAHDHSHDEGPHDGVVAGWGDEEFHAEFTVDHDTKTATVYILDEHAKNAPKVEPAKITKVTLAITNVSPPLTLEMKFDPAKTDSKGIAFSATHDQFGKKMNFEGNISGKLNGKDYSGDFKEGAHGEHDKKTGHLPDHPGGVHVAFAQGRYYAEAILHKGGSIHLFLFGKDLAKVVEAESQVITAYVRAVGDMEFQTFEFKPEPLPGDMQGNTSRFAGSIPAELRGKPLEISIPALKLGKDRYHLAFQTTDRHANGEHAVTMPAKAEADEEKRLYLTPAGIYTAEDIKANGNLTASVKFKDFKSAHDLRPKPGDKICPVTLTKAHPQCTWVIAGKVYEFCCPPCVDEFVKLAKEEPAAVKPPGEYVKK